MPINLGICFGIMTIFLKENYGNVQGRRRASGYWLQPTKTTEEEETE